MCIDFTKQQLVNSFGKRSSAFIIGCLICSVSTGIGRVNLQQLSVCSCGLSLGRTCFGCGLGLGIFVGWNDAVELFWSSN